MKVSTAYEFVTPAWCLPTTSLAAVTEADATQTAEAKANLFETIRRKLG